MVGQETLLIVRLCLSGLFNLAEISDHIDYPGEGGAEY